jgi:FkbM family methyltransferase
MRKLLKQISYFLTLARLYFLTGNASAARHLAKEGVVIKRKKGQILLPDMGIDIDPKKHLYLLKGIHNLCSLEQNTNITLEVAAENQIIANINDCRFYINSKEELFILNEVFARHIYDVSIPCKSVVIDIGMNIADTAIYFASKKEIEKVYAYEPFKPTYEAALRNIELNPKLSAKIKPYNFGLSDKEEDLVCDYSIKHKGCVGISDTVSCGKLKGSTVKEKIKVFPVADEIIKAKKSFPEHKLIMKADCEGSEFQIIESLDEKNLLGQIDIMLLEWHIRQPNVIINALLKAGFAILNRDNFKNCQGMLYAFKVEQKPK